MVKDLTGNIMEGLLGDLTLPTQMTTSVGVNAHAEGGTTVAYGDCSHSEGI
jgi:hypothetical protein